MRTRVAIAATLIALIAALAIVLAGHKPERTGVNGIAPAAYVASLRPGQSICQPATIPPGTGAVGLTAGVYGRPGPPLAVTLTGPAGTLRGSLAGGYASGAVSARLAGAGSGASGLLCIRNAGRERVALAGVPAASAVSTIDGKPSTAAIELEYLRGTASGFALGTTVARRVGLLHFGPWLLWALVALMIFTAAGAVLLAAREVRE